MTFKFYMVQGSSKDRIMVANLYLKKSENLYQLINGYAINPMLLGYLSSSYNRNHSSYFESDRPCRIAL